MHIKKTCSFHALQEAMPLNNSLKNDIDDDTFDLESATQTDIEGSPNMGVQILQTILHTLP